MSADVLNNEYAQALANFAGLFGMGLFLVGCVMAAAENSIAAERSDTKGMAITSHLCYDSISETNHK